MRWFSSSSETSRRALLLLLLFLLLLLLFSKTSSPCKDESEPQSFEMNQRFSYFFIILTFVSFTKMQADQDDSFVF